MCSKQARRDPYWALAHQTTQNATLTTSGLLKCGNLMKCWEQERGDLYLTSWSSMMIWTLTPPQNRTFHKSHGDILTKENFTRHEWNNLFPSVQYRHFSSVCCSQNFSSTRCPETMAKRMRQKKGEDKIVGKSMPTTMNLAFTVSTSSSIVQSPTASKSPGILRVPCQNDWKSTGKLVRQMYTAHLLVRMHAHTLVHA